MATVSHPPVEIRGRPAAPGLALGPLVVLRESGRVRRTAGDPAAETAALKAALGDAVAALRRIAREGTNSDAVDILEFQIAMLEDETLTLPAFAAVIDGAAADFAWARAVDEQIRDYEAAAEEYFRARASDLRDMRDRVLKILAGASDAADIPAGAVVIADDLTPSRFLEIDWSRGGAVALAAGSPSSHVAMLARARGVPMIVGLGAPDLHGHREGIADGTEGLVMLSPDEVTRRACRAKINAMVQQRDDERGFLLKPAVTAEGRPIAVMINVAEPGELTPLDPAWCDGIGLVRTEFLFRDGLPDEERQYAAYRAILAWAAGRPVTIRTLDAGGDKPISGLTVDGESNPFLGVRGVRLSLARPDIFRIQLRALARAATHGNLKIMIPMVTVPAELEATRRLLNEMVGELNAAGQPVRLPPLGMMVEVPAAALAIDMFDADFFSIGSNDLTQYVTASARDIGAVAELNDPANPAVLRLIEAVINDGARRGVEVSLCGDMGGEPACIPQLLSRGLAVLSVAPAALPRTKAAIARFGHMTERR
jgi:phosphoenolpyruvate-protein phosphotransferase (PTS system enzyme I)